MISRVARGLRGLGVEMGDACGEDFGMKTGERFFDVSSEVRVWGRYDATIRTWMHSTALRAEGGAGWWILDPIVLHGVEWESWVKLLEADGGVSGYLLTNGNHERELGEWMRRFPGTVFAHRDAVAHFAVGVDGPLEEGMVLAGGYEVVGLCGAGPGEVAFFREGISVHFGDGLLNLEETDFAFLPEKYCVDARALRASVARLAGCSATVATFAHGGPLRGDVGQRISALCAG